MTRLFLLIGLATEEHNNFNGNLGFAETRTLAYAIDLFRDPDFQGRRLNR